MSPHPSTAQRLSNVALVSHLGNLEGMCAGARIPQRGDPGTETKPPGDGGEH